MIQLKNRQEIEGIRKSGHLLADLFRHLDGQIAEGMSTYDVDMICHDYIKKHHAVASCYGYMGYPAATCVSVNDTVIHGIPSKKIVLKEGDLVSVDITLDLDGYVSDSTHTYEIGKVSDEVHQLNVVTEKALYNAIDAAGRKGARLHDIAQAVEDTCKPYGYGIVRDYCGHGVGLSVHEDPSIPNCPSRGPNPRIQAGMVLAIEPMINMGTDEVILADDGWTVLTADGKLSAHAEHTVAVFSDHTEVLTLR